jgi:glucokinase
MRSSEYYLGIDLGGTHIRSVVARDDVAVPRIIGRDERVTPRSGADDIVRAIAESTRTSLAAVGASLHEVAAVACSAPGPLDHRSGIVHEAPNVVGFIDFPLGSRLAEALGLEAIYLDRDTIMAAVGEAVAGAAQGARNFIYVTISTGIGGAIVIDGRLLRGAANTAGEIGHFPVALEGPRCGCGSYGCVESLAAGRFVAEAFGVDDAAQVYAAAAAQVEAAEWIVTRAERALGNLAIGLANALSPALIVVGGSVAEHEPSHTLEPMRRAIAERAFKVAAAAVTIVPAALGRDVGMLGAVIYARERVAGRDAWFR